MTLTTALLSLFLTVDPTGIWVEKAQLSCADGSEVTPEKPILEFEFLPDRQLTVTWLPFEIYKDYWADYQVDESSGEILVTLLGGNYIPPDFDGSGRVVWEGDGFRLEGLWLGTPYGGTAPANCGHRFGRR
jgi:hypothetical protein